MSWRPCREPARAGGPGPADASNAKGSSRPAGPGGPAGRAETAGAPGTSGTPGEPGAQNPAGASAMPPAEPNTPAAPAAPTQPTDFECTTLLVPLDYAHPDAGSGDVRLSVSRKRATDKARRLGSLLVNPGGPGGSAVGYLQAYAALGYPAPVRARYDMVAADPRGVARSEPVTCLPGRDMDAYVRVDQTPDDATERHRLVRSYQEHARGCQRRSGRLLGHVSTVEAARDMDVLRAALGDRRLTYVGASYGTFLGATYAGLFPTRVGRLVLDGAMDPTLTAGQMNLDQTGGFETAVTAFLTDCVRRAGCPLGTRDRATAVRRLAELFQRIDARPLPTRERRTLTESLATTGVLSAMYDEGAWPLLRTGLAAAGKGDGTGLLQLADAYYERSPDGTYSNLMAANQAVNCLDLPPSFRRPADVSKALPAFEKASPLFGSGLAWAALSCTYWPVEATGGPHRIEAAGAPPILVVGTTRDPATPYRWARALAAQLSSGHLLTYEGDGHTAYGRGSTCIDTTINTYLLTGHPPTPAKRCS
ncbi:alpha/beta fold hydrolase [Streptomyces sp. HSW2009]|uniref:alpha/beta fold hydrolase n=1 Tax=Streptomyces sp. HSW2009 TaxID=3142890 RepID=UPI0032EACB90